MTQRLGFDLPDALLGQTKVTPQLFERGRTRVGFQAESTTDDLALAFSQTADKLPNHFAQPFQPFAVVRFGTLRGRHLQQVRITGDKRVDAIVLFRDALGVILHDRPRRVS